ncbi:chemotaxis protein CheB [Pedobacter sp. PLR]|uniref:chemotaxis protein CheB n=1 Tax=Pedobacter sp. PLR TaxID=2994465 RepID=UPI0022463922|nr:chemotaxis protein CheB [Pedobacter sp. PLR]MCX2453446.1 chemotaxis protein CheB [Pedobacter sp. PLR]
MSKNEVKNIIVIGTSAGGINAVSKLVAGFDKDFDAAVFVVIHISRNSLTEVILSQIQKHTILKCVTPKDGEKIMNKVIYLAPADHHMMIEKKKILIRKGAYDNHWRPSIDVLFRSAAAAYDSCVTGIILTGLLDDGTSGMSAIKRSGGRCMVQDPEEADFPDMPNSVLKSMEVDYKVSINEMGYILSDLFSRKQCEVGKVPADVKLEAQITMRMSSSVKDLEKLGPFTPFTCPDCGGVLVKVKNDQIARYRCYTGHTYTEKALESEKIKRIEESLWVAIRMMEERKNLLEAMESDNSNSRIERAGQMKVHIERLKSMLLDLNENLYKKD